MKVTTDFECGSGRLKKIRKNTWRLDTVADRFKYNRYFAFRVESGKKERPTTLHFEVHPDPALGQKSHFITHFPSHIWYTTREWGPWAPLRNTWESSVTFHETHLELHIPIAPGTVMHVVNTVPLRYSDLMTWTKAMKDKHGDRLEVGAVGKSVEGRDIPFLRIRKRGKKLPKLFVLAGQHSSEFGGIWGCEGIVEYALSQIAEAREITDHFDLALVPMVNPDGNVHGNSGANAEQLDVNICNDFKGAAEGKLPRTHENRLLWKWLCSTFPPCASLHFHGYLGWKRRGDYPGDGVYCFAEPEKLFGDRPRPAWAVGGRRRAMMQAMLDRLLFETPGFTAHWRTTGTLTDSTLEYQLAQKFGTVGVLYEINAGCVGPAEQFQRGPEVLGAVVRALVRDAPMARTK